MDGVEPGVVKNMRLGVSGVSRHDDVALQGPRQLPVDPGRSRPGELGDPPRERENARGKRQAARSLQQLTACQ